MTDDTANKQPLSPEQQRIKKLEYDLQNQKDQLSKKEQELAAIKKEVDTLSQLSSEAAPEPTKPKPMKTPQGLNNAMFSLNIGAIILGLRDKALSDFGLVEVYVFFFILLRIKMYIDASYFLEDETSDARPKKAFGYVLSICSWILFTYSGYHLFAHTQLGLGAFIAAVFTSTIWLALICIDEHKKKQKGDVRHITWLITNLVYMACTAVLMWYWPAEGDDSSNRYICLLRGVMLLFLCVTLIIDTLRCKTLEVFGWKDSTPAMAKAANAKK